MQATALLVVALAALPPAEEPAAMSLLALDLEPNGVSEQEVKILNALVVQALSRHRDLAVLSSADIRQMVDLAAEQQTVGCDTTSCLAEVAGAMGAAYVVYGQAGRLGDVIVVQLNLFDSATGVAVGREKVETSDMGGLPKLIEPAVDRLVAGLVRTAPEPRAAPEAADDVTVLPWVVAGGGAALAAVAAVGVGAGLLPVLQHGEADALIGQYAAQPNRENLDDARAQHLAAAQASEDWQTWGGFLVAGGSVVLLAGATATAAGLVWALSSGAESE